MFNNAKKTILKKIIFFSAFYVLMNCTVIEAASFKKNAKEGNLLYEKGDYVASKEKYRQALEKEPESDVINFNFGTALYKDEDYEKAVNHFQKVFLSEDDELKEKAHYNLGNTLYKAGIVRADEDVARAISNLEKSLAQYERALSIDKADDDAKHNYSYVQTELERLKIKQQQQQSQQQQSEESKDQEQQQNQQSQEEQESQQQQQDSQDQQSQKGQEQQQKQDQQEQGEQSQNDQKKSDQQRGQKDEKDYNKQQEDGAQPQEAQELTKEEAQMLLEGYQQTEEPQGLLNVHPKATDARPVLKDW